MSDELDELVWMDAAARAVGMHRDRVKALAIANGIAIRWGGTDKRPRLKVNVAKLKAVICRQVYIPPAAQQVTRKPSGKLHRLAQC